MQLKWMSSVRGALLSVGGIGIGAALLVSALALWSFQQLEQSAQDALKAKDVVADILPPPMYLIEMRLVLSQGLEGSLAPEETARRFEALAKDYAERVAYWRANPPPGGLQSTLLGEQHRAGQAFIEQARRDIVSPLQAGQPEVARQALAAVHQRYQTHRAGVDVTVKAGTTVADGAMTLFAHTHDRGMWTLPAATAVLLLAMIVCFGWARQSILAPLSQCVVVAHRVAQGDLTEARAPDRADEIGELQSALQQMTVRLAHMVGQVRQGVEAIAHASTEIATGNADLSQRTERQAGHVQQTASSLEQIAQAVQSNADHAHSANALSSAVASAAEDSGRATGAMAATMAEIHEASVRIRDITGVIDSIAFQTNILALNAAVEAARAGEHGRGFNVVASEVRALAQRSAEAAREIKALVLTSSERVERGHEQVGVTAAKMQAVVQQAEGLSHQIAHVFTASEEQRDGVRHINAAVVDIDRTTQQNAALVEETASAAEQLRRQTDHLASLMRGFHVPREGLVTA